ncbi:MAG: hypothetical protein ACLRWF_08655 [Ruthenibacterium sp.]
MIRRCETITEGESGRAAQPYSPRSLNGVARRCNAGMGRRWGFAAARAGHHRARAGIPPGGADGPDGTYLITARQSRAEEKVQHV